MSDSTNRNFNRLYLASDHVLTISLDLAVETGLEVAAIITKLESVIRERGVWRECSAENVRACDHPLGPGSGHWHKWIPLAQGELIGKGAGLLRFWTRDAADRHLAKATERGFIIEADYNVKKRDSTRWFAINFAGILRLNSIAVPVPPDYLKNGGSHVHDNLVTDNNLDTPLHDSPTNSHDIYNIYTHESNNIHEGHGSSKGETLFDNTTTLESSNLEKQKPAFNYAEGYEARFRRIVREGYVIACGYQGREALIGKKEEGQITDGLKVLRELYQKEIEAGEITPPDLKEMVIGFGVYFQQGVWYNVLPGQPRKTFDEPNIPTVTGKLWGKYADYCIKRLKGGIPRPGQKLP